MFSLTIENLKHIIEEFEFSRDKNQIKVRNEAQRELNRRMKLLGGK